LKPQHSRSSDVDKALASPLWTSRRRKRCAPAACSCRFCVDCKRRVVVCRTGIGIRNGLQIDCIGGARCIDACDEAMV
jgi:polyferredoxin